MPSESSNCQTPRKQRLLDPCLPLQSPSHGEYSTDGVRSSSNHGNSSVQVKLDFDKPNNHLQGSPNRLYSPHNLSRCSNIPKVERTEPAPTAPSSKLPHNDTSVCTDKQFANGQHKKKRSKKHKDKERERLKPGWIETSPDLKQNQGNLKGNWPRNYRTVFFKRFRYKYVLFCCHNFFFRLFVQAMTLSVFI